MCLVGWFGLVCLFCLRQDFSVYLGPGIHFVVQVGLKLQKILLPLHPQCLDPRCAPPHPARCVCISAMSISCFTCPLCLGERGRLAEVLLLAVCPVLHPQRSESLQGYAGTSLSLKLLKRREPGGAHVGS